MLRCYAVYRAEHAALLLQQQQECSALDECEPALLIQELLGESRICLEDTKQGCEREN